MFMHLDMLYGNSFQGSNDMVFRVFTIGQPCIVVEEFRTSFRLYRLVSGRELCHLHKNAVSISPNVVNIDNKHGTYI
jgi:hypothetical protein